MAAASPTISRVALAGAGLFAKRLAEGALKCAQSICRPSATSA